MCRYTQKVKIMDATKHPLVTLIPVEHSLIGRNAKPNACAWTGRPESSVGKCNAGTMYFIWFIYCKGKNKVFQFSLVPKTRALPLSSRFFLAFPLENLTVNPFSVCLRYMGVMLKAKWDSCQVCFSAMSFLGTRGHTWDVTMEEDGGRSPSLWGKSLGSVLASALSLPTCHKDTGRFICPLDRDD